MLRAFFERNPDGTFKYRTGLYSTIKKSGKTTIAALVQQWACETWGEYGEIYHLGNKLGQAQDRAFKLTRYSIELSPYRHEWEMTATKLTHLPSNSFIRALPLNAAGEAGGNQRLTTWTEFHGYRYEEDERFYAELQPVPTQPLSFRFVESYAGYEGESILLKNLWERVQSGTRVHPDYPIYANESTGTIGYIDTGIEARRMVWQTPEYYRLAEAEETPSEFQRLHLNEWVSSENEFVNAAAWELCKGVLPALQSYEQIVVGLDAARVNDTFAMVGVSRREHQYYVRFVYVWKAQPGHPLSLNAIREEILKILVNYPIIMITYDPYQLDLMMEQFAEMERYWVEPFSQTSPRAIADHNLLHMILSKQITHDGNATLTEHITNANAKQEDSGKLRMVKRNENLKIDAAVALSMAVHQAKELLIG